MPNTGLICPSCQHENPEAARFCQGCGSRFLTRCTHCGAGLPVDARFCHECGGPTSDREPERAPAAYTPKHLAARILTSRSALEGERKQVTVLFADVKGSMELAEQVDPEEWHQMLDRFFQILAEGVHRYEGTINQYTGDGIMALFGAPIAHEDHAQRACYAALHLVGELRRYATELRVERGLNFATRIGINSGEVVVAKIGDDLRMDYTAQGHTVGLAARMEQIAEPGTAYVTEHTARLVSGFFELSDLGRTPVKGSSASVGVYELRNVGPMRTRLDLSRSRGFSPFVGRAAEMATLEGALQAALRGEGEVVGVVGEPGVGKSRLCTEFVEKVRARGIAVYEAHCPAHGRALPYLPLLELLRGLFDVDEGDGEHEARRKIAGELLLLDPGFQENVSLIFEFLGVPDPERPAPAMDPQPRQEKLFGFVRSLVRARSELAPAVLCIDDLHWIDPASDAFLTQMVEAVGGARVLLLLNFRPEYAAAWMEGPGYRSLPLSPLDAQALDELVRDLLGAHESVAELAATIRERTRGNPFFIEELVQSLVEAGGLTGERGAYRLATPVTALETPPTVHAVLDARIDRLPAREKQVLHTAAVIGKEFPESILARVLGFGPDDLAGSLGLLRRAEFIHDQALYPEPEYAFRHPLTQEVAYGTQLSEARARTHARVARALAEANPEKQDELAALLAQHWEAARDPLEAARWYSRAARWVQPRDFREALHHWRKVRSLLLDRPESEEGIELGIAARTGILMIGGRQGIPKDEAESLLAEGRKLAERAGSVDPLSWLLSAYGVACTFTGDFEEALQVFSEQERLAALGGNSASRILARILTAMACDMLGRLPEALETVDSVLEQTEGDRRLRAALAGGPTGRAGFWSLRATILTSMGRLDEALCDSEHCLEEARASGALEWAGVAHGTRAGIATLRGDAERALAEARRGLEIGDRIGYLNARLVGLFGLGAACLLKGEWIEATDFLEDALDATQRSGNVAWETRINSALAEAYLQRGDAERARAMAKSAITVSALRKAGHHEAEAQLALARVLLATEGAKGTAAAESALKRAAGLIEKTGAGALAPEVHLVGAELARVVGDAAERKRELGRARRLLEEMGAVRRVEQLEALSTANIERSRHA